MNDPMNISQNPLFVKHVRSRLRRQEMVPSIAAVVVVAACIVWGGLELDGIRGGGAFVVLLVLQSGLLFFVGASSVATAVSHAREQGIIEFHRICPQPALAVALGFAVGAPVREYVLFLCTLPFALVLAALGPPGLAGYVSILVAMVSSAVLFQFLAALVGMTVTRPRDATVGSMGLILGLHFGGSSLLGVLTIIPTAAQVLGGADARLVMMAFFGLKMPALLLTLIHQIPIIAFVLMALVRRMRSEFAPTLSKPQAVGVQATAGILLLGDIWSLGAVEEQLPFIGVLYATTFLGVLLTAVTTPGMGAFAKGLRRARKLGQAGIPMWSDEAPNWASLIACLVIVADLALAASWAAGAYTMTLTSIALPTAVAVLALLGFGCAWQYFGMYFGKAGVWYFGLWLFLCWIMPLPVGMVLVGAGYDEAIGVSIMSASPIAGIAAGRATADLAGSNADTMLPQVVAVIAALVWALVFLFLRLRTEREAKEVALAMEPTGESKAA